MENRKLIYLFGMMFSIVFAAFYFFLFNNFITDDMNTKTLYFNQVGLYKDETNSAKMIETLKGKDIEAYPVKKDDITAVVCSIFDDQTQTQAQQETLTSMGLTFIEKQVKIEDSEVLSLLENKEYSKALEMMKY